MAPPRKRTSKNRDLPQNLYPNGKYWQYCNPITGKKVSINRPLAEAVKLAKAANARLVPLTVDDGALLALLTGEEAPTFARPSAIASKPSTCLTASWPTAHARRSPSSSSGTGRTWARSWSANSTYSPSLNTWTSTPTTPTPSTAG